MSTESTAEEEIIETDSEIETVVEDDEQSIDATADSSAANDDEDAKEEPKSLLEAVSAAIEIDAKEESSSISEEGNEETDASVETDTDDTPPFHEHPRWQEMITERDSFKQSHQELMGLKSYMTEAGLSIDEVNTGFEIMKNIKENPQAALEALAPYIDQMETSTGRRLSADIQERVDEGYLDEESAREMSQLRSREQLATEASQRAAAQAQQIQQQQQVQQHATNVSGAVSEWETQWSSSDPDYKLKQPKVMEKIELYLLKNGAPSSREQAVQIAEECRKSVNNELLQFRPRKGSVNPITGGSSPKSTPEPKSLMEAMQQGLAAAQ